MNRPKFWTIEFFVDPVTGACSVEKFLDRLPDAKFAAIDVALKFILEPSGISLCGSPWMKALGGGLFEFRIRNNAHEIAPQLVAEAARAPAKILIRVFVHFYGERRAMVLHVYDKAINDSHQFQSKQIQVARDRLRAWKQR